MTTGPEQGLDLSVATALLVATRDLGGLSVGLLAGWVGFRVRPDVVTGERLA